MKKTDILLGQGYLPKTNQYHKKIKSKKKLRKQVMRQMWSRHFESEEDYLAHPPTYRIYPITDRDRYKRIYVSGSRRYAKEQTNRAIRAKYRNLRVKNVFDMDDDDLIVMRAGDYKKMFEYEWTLW